MSVQGRIAPIVLIIVTILVHLSGLQGVFLFDDFTSIVDHPGVQGTAPLQVTPRYIADLTFRLNVIAGGNSVIGFHAVNIGIHVISVLLLFGILRRTCRRIRKPVWCMEYSDGFAFACAIVWGLHPLTTQAVTYICQRYESLMAMFLLACLYCFIRAVSSQNNARAWFAGSLACCLTGMGVKPIMAAAPFLLLFYDNVFTRDEAGGIRTRSLQHFAYFLSLGVMILFGLLFTARGMNEGLRMMKGVLGPVEYSMTQVVALYHYLQLSIIPLGQSFDYAPLQPEWSLWICIGAVLLVSLFAISLAGIWTRKPAGYAGAWFFIILLPTSSFVPVADTMYEHRMYLPLAGIVVLVLGALFSFVYRTGVKEKTTVLLLRTVVLILAACLALLTWERNLLYHSPVTLWTDTISRQPANLRARNLLAVALSERGDFDGARRAYEGILAGIPPQQRDIIERGQVRVDDVFNTLSYEYHFFVAYANLGSLLVNTRQDFEGAAAAYARALMVAPNHAVVRGQLGRVLQAQGVAKEEVDREIDRRIFEAVKKEGGK
jgi:protein O-mannosyl-transferase